MLKLQEQPQPPQQQQQQQQQVLLLLLSPSNAIPHAVSLAEGFSTG